MDARALSSSPSLLPLYARAAVAMLPGASMLPFVPGGGGEIPEVELTLAEQRLDAERVAAYSKVCGFSLRDTVPATYPHVLAFPLHMAAMADGRFPFGAVGLVHIENRILQRRPLALGEELQLRVRAGKLEPHPSGRAFSLRTEGLVSGKPVWEEVSTFLRRGGGEGERSPERSAEHAELAATAEWRLPGDLGRRYAGVSGDRNPIHMHALSAKAFGFPRAIAHGMWTKARCLAALEARLPGAFAVRVRFRKPILLPARVSFMEAERGGGEIDFAVRDSERQTPHLQGSVETVESTGGART